MKTTLFLSLCLLLAGLQATASHLRGGYIQVKSVSALSYEINIYVFADEVNGASASASAGLVSICFGDGSTQEVIRISRVLSANRATSISTYRVVHTYAGPGTYTLTSSIVNRTGVLNIERATDLPMTLTTVFTTGTIKTPTLTIPDIGFTATLNQRFVLPFSSSDFTGDNLRYSLARPLTSPATNGCTATTTPSYQYPNDVTKQGTFKLDNRTGILTWDAPTKQGYYSAAISVNEYRDGTLISQTQFEILVTVIDAPGTPGVIPPYEPATEVGLVTALPDYRDEPVTLATFPNPVEDRLQVVVQSSSPSPARIRLLGANGQILHELSFIKPARQHEQVISMTGVSPGIYFLQANVGGQALVRKVVKK